MANSNMPSGDYEVRIVPNTNDIFRSEVGLTMKETTAYRSEYMVITCPYCEEVHYLDTADDMGEGELPESGRKMTCKKCRQVMRVLPY